MLSLTDLCNQYAWLYTALPIPAGTWDAVEPTDGAYCAVKIVGDTAYIFDRGSVTSMDWYDDFRFNAIPFYDPKLGWIHNGFREGVLSNVGYVESLTRGLKVVYVGHSLGAGRARIRAGYRIADGKPVAGLFTFGAPRAGGPRLTTILKGGVKEQSYRNSGTSGHDLVTDVPIRFDLDIPFIGQQGIQYEQPCQLIDVNEPPPVTDKWGPFRFHHFGLYCRAFNATGPAALSLPV